jgi:hypothetical protein
MNMTENDRLKGINESTAAAPHTAAGLIMNPDSLRNLGPTLVDGEGGVGEVVYTAARAALQSMYTALGAMDDATKANLEVMVRGRDSRNNTMEVPPDKRPALAAAMGQRFEGAAKSVDRSVGAVREAVAALEKAVDSKLLNPRRNETGVATAAVQIRDYIKSLSGGGERLQFLQEAIKDGQHEVASAVLGTTGWVSGLTPKEQQTIRALAEQKFAPRETAQRDAARKALDTVMQAGGNFVQAYHKMIPRIVPDKGTDAVRRLAGGAQ